MRILFVSRCLPLPVFLGDRLILFHLLDPAELELPYSGVTRFRDMEGTREITVNPALLRTGPA